MFKFFKTILGKCGCGPAVSDKKETESQYKCQSCGNTSKDSAECCGKTSEKICSCGSNKFSKECCKA